MTNNNNNYCACTGDEAQYTIKLNQQGPVGPMGPQGLTGQDGFSPIVTVASNTPNEYTLRITTAYTSYVTPNFLVNADAAIEELDTKLSGEINTLNTNLTSLENEVSTIDAQVKVNESDISDLENKVQQINTNITNINTDLGNKANRNLNNVLTTNYAAKLNNISLYSIVRLPSAGKSEAKIYPSNEGSSLDILSGNDMYLGVSNYPYTNSGNFKTGFYINDATINTKRNNQTYINIDSGNVGEYSSIYTAGSNIDISNNTISVEPNAKLGTIEVEGLVSNSDNAPNIWRYNNSTTDGIIGDTTGLRNLSIQSGNNINLVPSETGKVYVVNLVDGVPTPSEVLTKSNLPIASTTQLGGIKVGENLTITEDGTLNAQAGGSAELTNPLYLISESGDIDTQEAYQNSWGIKLIKLGGGSPMSANPPSVQAIGYSKVYNKTSGTTISEQNSVYYLLRPENILAGDGITVTPDSDTGTVTISSNSSGDTVNEKYGIEGDYATHYGILDCPNGLIDYNATGKDITLNQGVVLQLAGQDTKTTIATAITSTLTSSNNITLFYADGELLEVGKVDYSLTEPTDNGVDNYQAWYNPTVGKWQLKSNDTGNVWREVVGTPIANIYLNDSNITRIDYIGYRILDDDILVQQSEIETLNETITTLTNTINSLEERLAALEANINGGNA